MLVQPGLDLELLSQALNAEQSLSRPARMP